MLKKILIITPLVFIFIILLIVVLHWRTRLISDSIQQIIRSNISGVDLTYDEVQGDLLQNVTITGLNLRFENGTRFKTNKVRVSYSLFSTISKKYHFDSVIFDSLWVFLASAEEDTGTGKSLQVVLNDASRSEWYKDIIHHFPDIRFGRLSIAYGRVSDEKNDLLVDDIKLDLSGSMLPGTIDVDVKSLSGNWTNRQTIISDLSFQLEGNDRRTTLNRLHLKTPNSSILAAMDAEISDSFQVIIGLSESHVSVRDINQLI